MCYLIQLKNVWSTGLPLSKFKTLTKMLLEMCYLIQIKNVWSTGLPLSKFKTLTKVLYILVQL